MAHLWRENLPGEVGVEAGHQTGLDQGPVVAVAVVLVVGAAGEPPGGGTDKPALLQAVQDLMEKAH